MLRQWSPQQASEAANAHHFKPAKPLSLSYSSSSTTSLSRWINTQDTVLMGEQQCLAVICSHIHHHPLTKCNHRENSLDLTTHSRPKPAREEAVIAFSFVTQYERGHSASHWDIQALKSLPTFVHQLVTQLQRERVSGSHGTDVSTVFMMLKIKQDKKRMQRNISQHKQQNAVQNECWLMSMPVSLQRNSGGRRTCNQSNLYCVHTTDWVTGISNNTEVRIKGSSRGR